MFARTAHLSILALTLAYAGCGAPDGHAVDDDEAARLAYLGLDRAVGRAIQLGFDGFNAASSANIPEQSQPGELAGRMVVGGKVDQGASANKGMRLDVTLTDGYADVVLEGERDVTYDGGPAAFDLSFKGLPDADLSGTLHGSFTMEGDLAGAVTLDLTITGETEAGPGDTIVRKAGTIHVTGTATSDYGVYDIDVAL